MPNIINTIKALRQLNPTEIELNALYKMGLKTGYFRFEEERKKKKEAQLTSFIFLFELPTRETLLAVLQPDGLKQLTAEADEIVSGRFRQFGGNPLEIQITPPPPLHHWTNYETRPALQPSTSDIKLTWEPARFGWAFTLGRAYHITGDEKYAAAFWRYFDEFSAANPPFLGPNWMSGQEVGLRLMAFTWAGQVFASSRHSTPGLVSRLTQSIAAHAERIPPTLLYARSQNNNHLLTESAALYTAASALPDHPDAANWRKLGKKWLDWCFEHQIDKNGEYIQHSSNYHRLMLQTALWVYALARREGGMTEVKYGKDRPSHITPQAHERLDAATKWLMALTDPISGRAANFGPNDGAYIFPLANCPYDDYRPVLQAAWMTFSANRPFETGPWDEMAHWFGTLRPENEPDYRLKFTAILSEGRRLVYMRNIPATSAIASPGGQSWAYLRSTKFTSRPGHADLLHLDLWWRGLNIAQDAGTYHYNAPPPWDNALTHAAHHNTITIDGADQFTRAGRFLYLDWRNVKSHYNFASSDRWNTWQGLAASHNAYEPQFGVRHHRQVNVDRTETWTIHDRISFTSWNDRTIRLHWLLPDWEWKLESSEQSLKIGLHSPHGWITLKIDLDIFANPPTTTLVRAGEVLWGNSVDCPTRGWVSPTYGVKLPALSLAVEVRSSKSVEFTSQFILPTPNDDPSRLEALAQKLEQFTTLIQSAASPENFPMEPAFILPILAETALKIRQGKIEALEEYRYKIDSFDWDEIFGKDGEKLLKSIDSDIWHFRLY